MVDTEYITKSAGLDYWPEPDVITDGDSLEFDEENPRAYMGIEPSGSPHIGHLVQLERLNRVEEAGFDTYVLVADQHAIINGKPEGLQNKEKRKERIYELSEEMINSLDPLCNPGIDFIYGSNFQEDKEYRDIVQQIKLDVPAKRAIKAVGDVASDGSISAAQVEYPLMQVADMYYFGEEGEPVDLAIGGTDQRKIHAIARDYPPIDHEVDSVHFPLIGNHLTSDKMSKDNDPIFIEDSEEVVKEKINSLYFPTDLDTVSRDFDLSNWNPVKEEKKAEEAIIKTSIPAQLAAELVYARGDSLELERADKHGGDVEYEDLDRLLEDTVNGVLHPSDTKDAVAREINELLNN